MKIILKVVPAVLAIFIFSGCSLGTSPLGSKSASKSENFLKSTDNGGTWTAKTKTGEKTTLSPADILSMAISPLDPNVIYLGTASHGIYMSKDGAENWANLKFADKVYGLVVGSVGESEVIYASGVASGRGKIFKREGESQPWKEIYTEPSDGTFISALATDRRNSQTIYAGTSDGVLIKSIDGGANWNNLNVSREKLGALIANIVLDSKDPGVIYLAAYRKGIFVSRNAGSDFSEVTAGMSQSMLGSSSVQSLFVDPSRGGTLYAGMDNGILRSVNYGQTWEALDIIESSKKFPVRALAINPKNSSEIIYSSSKAIYRSMDGGVRWNTFQLDTAKSISVIGFSPENTDTLYAGLRNF